MKSSGNMSLQVAQDQASIVMTQLLIEHEQGANTRRGHEGSARQIQDEAAFALVDMGKQLCLDLRGLSRVERATQAGHHCGCDFFYNQRHTDS